MEGRRTYSRLYVVKQPLPITFSRLVSEADIAFVIPDFTAGAIIDGFSNDAMSKSVDRVMKQLASEKGAKILKEREPRLPSSTFIKAYMEAFRPRTFDTNWH